MFDGLLAEMRSRSTEWLEARRCEVVGEIRGLQSEEHAILRVLDERGRVDVSRGLDGESARTLREKVETARALESLPAVAAAARAGDLSAEQLEKVVRLADEDSDAEWAARAPNMTAEDLGRKVREHKKLTAEDGQCRHAARSLRMRWEKEQGMLHVWVSCPTCWAPSSRPRSRSSSRTCGPRRAGRGSGGTAALLMRSV